ncbi:sulfatase, partial [Spirochaetota bacterium]
STTANYLGFFNEDFKKYTPNLDRIASKSLVMSNHYCQEPASLKSLYSILTGRYPYRTRNWKRFVKRTVKDISIAQILKKHGYDTLYLTSEHGKVYYQDRFLKGRFNRIIDRNALIRSGYRHRVYSMGMDDRVLIKSFDKFLNKSSKKFFVFLAPVFPHHPYHVPSKKFRINRKRGRFNRYKNSLFFADYIIGQIYKLLHKHKKINNTLVVIFSDHGEAFYQHPGNYLHSIYLYDENVKTFCIFSNPVLFEKSVYAPVTRHIDIVPTVLDLLGINHGAWNFDGISLLKKHDNIFAPLYTSFSNSYLGLRDSKWKYIINRRYNSEELYDLSNDSDEKINLTVKYPDLCKTFKERLLLFENYRGDLNIQRIKRAPKK